MAAYTNMLDRLVTCPYDAAHKVKESRLQIHIAKCRLNHLDNPKEVCPFNASHLVDRSELNFHILNCPDRAPLDRKVSQSLDKNNPFKGRNAVPSYSASPVVFSEEEYWDEESLDKNNPFKGRTAVPSYSASPVVFSEEEYWDEDVSALGYVPKQAPADAIVEPRPLAKPSEKKVLYKQLHRKHLEQQNAKSVPSANPSVPRQPNELSEIQKRRIAEKQKNIQTVENLAHERGFMPKYFDDDGFPALVCGRGIFRPPFKQGCHHSDWY